MTITILSKSNCAPCTAVKELLNKNEIKFTEFDAFDNPKIASRFGVRSVPTVIITSDPISDESHKHKHIKLTGIGIVEQVQKYINENTL